MKHLIKHLTVTLIFFLSMFTIALSQPKTVTETERKAAAILKAYEVKILTEDVTKLKQKELSMNSYIKLKNDIMVEMFDKLFYKEEIIAEKDIIINGQAVLIESLIDDRAKYREKARKRGWIIAGFIVVDVAIIAVVVLAK